MINIKFNYLYRDAGNYKKWGEVVFANPDRLPLDSITQDFERVFLQDGLFIAHQVRLPDVFLYTRGDAHSDDHCFHEFDAVESSLEAPSDIHARTITRFIAEAMSESERGWVAFDPHVRVIERVLD